MQTKRVTRILTRGFMLLYWNVACCAQDDPTAPPSPEQKTMSQAENQKKTGKRSIDMQFDVKAPVGALWKALTDGEELTHWFPPYAEVKTGVGGSVVHVWLPNPTRFEYPISIWEPNKHLRTLWPEPGVPQEDLQGEDWFFTDLGDGMTRVHLVNFGFSTDPKDDAGYESIVVGWDYFMWVLKAYAEKHLGKPRVEIQLQRKHSAQPATWKRLCAQGVLFSENLLHAKAGDRFTWTAGDEKLSGVVRKVDEPGHRLHATLENLNDALLSFRVGESKGFFSIATWGIEPARLKKIEESLSEQLEQKLGLKKEEVKSPAKEEKAAP
jgi:uncharacterized protein YndB with AHSA1/START domain